MVEKKTQSEIMREFISNSEPLYEMSNLAPDETGLDFVVFASPKGGAKHDARIKVTLPPWGSKPEAYFGLRPFKFVEGTNWLSVKQTQKLETWVETNYQTLIDFWDGNIIYDRDFRNRIKSISDNPPEL